jgi:DNA-binding transcriptional ArsR family regulator
MDYTDVVAALNSFTRRRILTVLQTKGLSVADLTLKVNHNPDKPSISLGLSRPNISQHLRILEAARLVQCKKQVTRHVYQLDRRGFDELRSYLDSFEGRSDPTKPLTIYSLARRKGAAHGSKAL